jgi:hypothetical protein
MAQDPKHAGRRRPSPSSSKSRRATRPRWTPKPDHGEESYKGCGKLEGRAAIITGGDSGIGRAVAIAFAREGADVLISYLPEEEDDARETARWVEQAGRRVVLVPGGIADQQHCKKLRIVMSSIMRRRSGLMVSSLIGGSRLEVGDGHPSILETGRLPRHPNPFSRSRPPPAEHAISRATPPAKRVRTVTPERS